MKDVLIDIPYVVRETVVLARKRKPLTTFRMATVPARVRMTEPGEGSPFRIGRPSTMNRHVSNAATGIVLDGVCHTDAIDLTEGRYGVPMGHPDFFARWTRAVRTSPAANHVPYRESILGSLYPTERDRKKFGMLQDAHVDPARTIESDEDEARAVAVKTAGCLVLHEGRLATSLLEPVVRRSWIVDGDGYVSSMPVRDVLPRLGSSDYVVAMDSSALAGTEALVGIPEGFDGWRLPDVECGIVSAWRRLGKSPGFSWGPAREEAARMRSFEKDVGEGRVGLDRLVETLDLLDGLVRRVGRWRHGDDEDVRAASKMARAARIQAETRAEVNAVRMSPST